MNGQCREGQGTLSYGERKRLNLSAKFARARDQWRCFHLAFVVLENLHPRNMKRLQGQACVQDCEGLCHEEAEGRHQLRAAAQSS